MWSKQPERANDENTLLLREGSATIFYKIRHPIDNCVVLKFNQALIYIYAKSRADP